ncbi:lytic polysaccharide monooxygenase auxiliary activity family 9 protein [Micromonospora craniellae]|uniref:Cellulose-binding protein n=1 Tax=Micromonospora craniellae TaxID=2294034 RepID=A0A372G449_9ACTN|nr:lytic polysaccharide monooxygenase [Micromonospora craniellae]QOC92904.1 lytic polysaccharide monooxygenase [Micromonospora craniellae]RFS47684.1 cellulose-binding protein [Micromonospora craniellae]
MSKLLRNSRALSLLGVTAGAMLLLSTALVAPASGHGSVANPVSRNYGCWQRWGSDFQNPRMATEDPMCWQAWQANPNAMWNWNGLLRDGVGGNHQGTIPDGQLCSGGRTESGRYNALDAVGAWRTTSVANSFRLKFYDQASHGADYIRVYATRPGYDALTKPLAWSDLELVGQIGNTPASRWQPETGGVSTEIPVNAPGRSGRHVLFTVWQASHTDQAYYICSDVQFGGGSNPPPTTPPASPTPTPTFDPPTTPPPTTAPPATGACSATYRVTSTWSGGFQGEVQVTAGSAAIRSWRVTWTYASGQQVSQAWNATVSSSGSTVTAQNVSYNGGLGAGTSTTFGFLASGSGSSAPTLTCTATT